LQLKDIIDKSSFYDGYINNHFYFEHGHIDFT
jgi:hypothetical protein